MKENLSKFPLDYKYSWITNHGKADYEWIKFKIMGLFLSGTELRLRAIDLPENVENMFKTYNLFSESSYIRIQPNLDYNPKFDIEPNIKTKLIEELDRYIDLEIFD